MDFTDDVRGKIIGGEFYKYEFWQSKKARSCANFNTLICKGWFKTDEDAVEWVKAAYPDEFQQGLEMRVYDQ